MYNFCNLSLLKPLLTPRQHLEILLTPNITEKVPVYLANQAIDWSMIVAIKSDYRRYGHRAALRESWAGIRFINGVRIHVMYVVALPESLDEAEALRNESSVFGDLLQIAQNETYRRRPSPKSVLQSFSSLFDHFDITELEMLKPLQSPRSHFKMMMTPNVTQEASPECIKNRTIDWTMVVAIKSDYRKRAQRDATRKSWGGIRFIQGVRLYVIYVVALPESRKDVNSLKKENAKYHDLLQVDMKEEYQSIGYKALAAMQWVGEHLPEDWIYFSADDDIVPNLESLFEKMKVLFVKAKRIGKIEDSLPFHCAYRYLRATRAQRSGKWIVNRSEYPFKKFPPICLGGFYGLSVKLAKAVYNASRYYPYFRLDDVFITGFMRLAVCDSNRTAFHLNRGDPLCLISRAASWNFQHVHVKPQEYVKLWNENEVRMRKQGVEICRRSLRSR